MNSSIRLTKMHRFRTLTFLDSKSRRQIFAEFSLEKQLTSSISVKYETNGLNLTQHVGVGRGGING